MDDKAGIMGGSLAVVGARQRGPNFSLGQCKCRLNRHNLVTTWGEKLRMASLFSAHKTYSLAGLPR